jgi:hypothetical protein
MLRVRIPPEPPLGKARNLKSEIRNLKSEISRTTPLRSSPVVLATLSRWRSWVQIPSRALDGLAGSNLPVWVGDQFFFGRHTRGAACELGKRTYVFQQLRHTECAYYFGFPGAAGVHPALIKPALPVRYRGLGHAGGLVLGRVSYARMPRFDSRARNRQERELTQGIRRHGTRIGIAIRSRA